MDTSSASCAVSLDGVARLPMFESEIDRSLGRFAETHSESISSISAFK
jgi:hypothetical protein